MPRKGDRKVRTGCRTCKQRKVKCDEVKPYCYRCTSTGRHCDGYAEIKPPQWMSSALARTTPNPSNFNGGLARHLEYYHYVAGPGLSEQFAEKFWTKVLPQIGERERAVRHALMAISMMYEDGGSQATPAMNHYNIAIRETLSTQDEVVTLIMAILFTCVEFMHGDPVTAVSHTQHAILMANRSKSLSGSWSVCDVIGFFFVGLEAGVPLF